MSFGFSVGDLVAISQLTWKTYRSCKGAPGEFQELSRELSSLHTILHELEDEAKTLNSLLNRRDSSRKAELDTLLRNLSDCLKQIEEIVARYHSLGRDQKKTWDRVKFATEDLISLRSKLSFHINGLNLFISSLSATSLAKIEGILDELVRDIREGRKEPTIISVNDDSDEMGWSELERELVGDGITKQDVQRYKKEIKAYLLKLVKENIDAVWRAKHNADDVKLETSTSALDSPDDRPEVLSTYPPPAKFSSRTDINLLNGPNVMLNQRNLKSNDWLTKNIFVDHHLALLTHAGHLPQSPSASMIMELAFNRYFKWSSKQKPRVIWNKLLKSIHHVQNLLVHRLDGPFPFLVLRGAGYRVEFPKFTNSRGKIILKGRTKVYISVLQFKMIAYHGIVIEHLGGLKSDYQTVVSELLREYSSRKLCH